MVMVCTCRHLPKRNLTLIMVLDLVSSSSSSSSVDVLCARLSTGMWICCCQHDKPWLCGRVTRCDAKWICTAVHFSVLFLC